MTRPREYPFRVQFQRGRVVHAARTDRMYVDGAGITACLTLVTPDDPRLPADARVSCVQCRRVKVVKEASL